MNTFIKTLTAEFKAHADSKIAAQQKAYLRNQFAFFGLKTPTRRAIQKPFFVKQYLPKKNELNTIIHTLWGKPEREYHYFAQELLFKYAKIFKEEDITLLEYMVENNAWWDTVDFIATKPIKAYFKKYPSQRDRYIEKWLASNNIWLQRSCIIFQLLEKEKTDTILLKHVITKLIPSEEFFINKAIGWALRDYSKTNPKWVVAFVENTDLHPLSKREALRLLD